MSASAHVATNERVAEVTADVIAALHEVLERHQVTEAEWLAALAYLTEVGRQDEFVLLSDVTRTSVLIDALSHQAEDPDVTASDVEGPLYREDPPWRERPVKLYDERFCPLKDKTPEDIDFVVVRENNEGLYTGAGGFVFKGTPHEIAVQESINSRRGVERCLRFAFELTQKRNKRKKYRACEAGLLERE